MFNTKRYTFLFILLTLALALSACGGDDDSTDEEKKHATIAIHNAVPGVFDDTVAGLETGLRDLEYIDGENATVIHTNTNDALETALAEQEVDIIISIPGNRVSGTGIEVGDTPLLFLPSGDPIGQGLVDSLSEPGGNMTGVMLIDTTGRRFQLLIDTVPDATRVYYVYDSTHARSIESKAEMEEAANNLGIELVFADSPFGDMETTKQSIAAIPDDVHAIFIAQGHSSGLSAGWTEAAMRHQLPLVAEATGEGMTDYPPVVAYSPDMHAMGVQAARLIDQILGGINPGDLPVEPAEMQVIVDLRVAEIIDHDIPDAVLDQADVVHRAESDGDLPPLPPLEEADDAPVVSTGTGACQAVQTSPGGSNAVCVTIACDTLEDSGAMLTYTERVDMAGCATEGLVGTCTMETMDIHYYEGDAGTLEAGCGFLSGTWTAPQ